MKFSADNSYSLVPIRQECMIPVGSCFPSTIGPLLWYSPPILNQGVNLSFSIYPNYQGILQPVAIQSLLEID